MKGAPMTPRYLIPADAIPGLLDDIRPMRYRHPLETREAYLIGIDRGDVLLHCDSLHSTPICCALADVWIDPSDPRWAHRIADVLRSLGHEVGHLLPVALGGRVGDAVEETTCGACGGVGVVVVGQAAETCARCSGTGKLRRPVPASEASAKLLAASVAGVVAGRGVVRGVLGEWRVIAHADPDTGSTWIRSPIIGKRDGGLWVAECLQSWRAFGWECSLGTDPLEPWRWLRGPETGAAGRAAADAAALALGWALLSPDAPSGVVVPTWGAK